MNASHLKIIFFFALLILGGYLVLIIVGDKGLHDLNAMKQELNALKTENETLLQKNIEMHRTIQRFKEDPDFVENIAREKFKMIGKDEIVFKFKDKKTVKDPMPIQTHNPPVPSPDNDIGDQIPADLSPRAPVDKHPSVNEDLK